MTKKDYILLARAIRIQVNALFIAPYVDENTKSIVSTTIKNIVSGLMRELKRDNPRFDSDKFLEACELEK